MSIAGIRKAIQKDVPHVLLSSGGIAMIVKFMQVATPDYWSFGLGLGLIVSSLTGKTYWDAKSDTIKPTEPQQ